MATSAQSAHPVAIRWSRGWHYGFSGQAYAFACGAALLAVLAAGTSICYAQSAPPVATTAPSATGSGNSASAAAQKHDTPITKADLHRQQVVSACADMLKLATDLNEQVDKSTKDQLSAPAVQKAHEIEQLARKLKNANHQP